jgi:hypothetical protein
MDDEVDDDSFPPSISTGLAFLSALCDHVNAITIAQDNAPKVAKARHPFVAVDALMLSAVSIVLTKVFAVD